MGKSHSEIGKGAFSMQKKGIALIFIIALIICIPFFNGKYLFFLDFIPRLSNNITFNLFYGFINPDFGGNLPAYLFAQVISFEIFQKLILLLILLLSGISGYLFLPSASKIARLFAGLLYMLNPYTFVRIIVGHWTILLAYAILPLVIIAFIELVENKGNNSFVKFVILLTLVGFDAHTLLIAFIAMGIIFSLWLWRNKDAESIKKVILACIFVALLSVYWLIPLITAKDMLISNIGSDDLDTFAPRIEGFSILFTLASLYGFWREGYSYAKDFLPFWQVMFTFILFLVVDGFISYYKNEKIGIYVKSFGLIAVVGLIFAAGVQSPFSELFRWLFESTLLRGMRDSHKFVALLVLSYAYLGALGVEDFLNKINNKENRKKSVSIAIVAIILATPIIYSFTFLNGFEGQIKPADFPEDWYEVNDFLNSDSQDFKVLFFPWHQYISIHWVPNKDKRITNPAQHFFDKEIISGKNIEIGGIYRQVYSPDQLYIDYLLKEKENLTSFGNMMAPLNIKYVLLTKEADYKKYFFLFNQSDIKLVKETENFYVFENEHKVGKFYEVDSIAYIKDWGELLEKSKNEDITQRVYLIGVSSENIQDYSEGKVLDYEKKTPVRYEVKENISKKYLVFTEPYSESWEFDDKKPMPAYGVANAYDVGEVNSKEMIYGRFYRVIIPSYIITILALLILSILYLNPNIRLFQIKGQGLNENKFKLK